MKLDEKTIQVLSNFQNINTSIAISPGSKIQTVNVSDSVIATAKVPDTFPKSFAIYELSKFLALMSLSKENDIDFGDSYLVIKQGSARIKFEYIEPSLIKTVDDDYETELPDVYVSFHLPYQALVSTIKAMRILKYDTISFIGDGEKIYIAAISTDNITSYSLELGETDKIFDCPIKSGKLEVLPEDYFIEISKEGFATLKGETAEYMVTLEYKLTKFGKKE